MASPVPSEPADNFLEGKLLIAMPGMPDPRFEKSVIFICAHSANGAMGLIVNKPLEGLSFRELMEKFEIAVTAEDSDTPILFGGPVNMGRGFVLHSADYSHDPATLPITSEISLTATTDILTAIAQGTGPTQSLLALGYAGWGEGQIEDEILANGWIHCDGAPALIFDTPYEEMWESAIATLGADISGLSTEAGRA
ncbi:MAG: YqgE/AlgH family protein [Rhizomicrobium sp.]|nr:YqgE/AlgH family protein [Rhizomicrobium sp.]